MRTKSSDASRAWVNPGLILQTSLMSMGTVFTSLVYFKLNTVQASTVLNPLSFGFAWMLFIGSALLVLCGLIGVIADLNRSRDVKEALARQSKPQKATSEANIWHMTPNDSNAKQTYNNKGAP